MGILNRLGQALQYVWEGASRIFGLDDNSYPETGVQPFEDDPYEDAKHRRQLL